MLTLRWLAITSVIVGYLAVWLVGPAAGLSFLGFEIGEWIKFLGVGAARNLFYLPPLLIGLILELFTMTWPNDRWQTWLMRAFGFAISLLAFPAIEAIVEESYTEWFLRLLLVMLVGIVGAISAVVAKREYHRRLNRVRLISITVFGALGLIAPLAVFLQVRPIVETAFARTIAMGPGIYLNSIGFLLLIAVCIWQLVTVTKVTDQQYRI